MNFWKSYFYLIIWKIIDFIGGLSDIEVAFNLWSYIFISIYGKNICWNFYTVPYKFISIYRYIYLLEKIYSGLRITLFASFCKLSAQPFRVWLCATLFDNGLSANNHNFHAETFGLIIDEFRNSK